MSNQCSSIIIRMPKKNEMNKAISSGKQMLISQGYNQEFKVKHAKHSIIITGCKS